MSSVDDAAGDRQRDEDEIARWQWLMRRADELSDLDDADLAEVIVAALAARRHQPPRAIDDAAEVAVYSALGVPMTGRWPQVAADIADAAADDPSTTAGAHVLIDRALRLAERFRVGVPSRARMIGEYLELVGVARRKPDVEAIREALGQPQGAGRIATIAEAIGIPQNPDPVLRARTVRLNLARAERRGRRAR